MARPFRLGDWSAPVLLSLVSAASLAGKPDKEPLPPLLLDTASLPPLLFQIEPTHCCPVVSRISWTRIIVVISTAYLLRRLLIRDRNNWNRYVDEHETRLKTEDLLIGTLRFGCERIENLHNVLKAGSSLEDLVRPNLARRRKIEGDECAERRRQGRRTNLDREEAERWVWRRKWQKERREWLERNRRSWLNRLRCFMGYKTWSF